MKTNFFTRILSLFADKRCSDKENDDASNSQATKEARAYSFFDLEKLLVRKEINGKTFFADEVIELPVTAECTMDTDPWGGKKHPELEVGKRYTVKVVRVDRSYTEIVLDGLRGTYNPTMFNITCDGEPYDFMAKAMPYYRRNHQYGVIGATLVFEC